MEKFNNQDLYSRMWLRDSIEADQSGSQVAAINFDAEQILFQKFSPKMPLYDATSSPFLLLMIYEGDFGWFIKCDFFGNLQRINFETFFWKDGLHIQLSACKILKPSHGWFLSYGTCKFGKNHYYESHGWVFHSWDRSHWSEFLDTLKGYGSGTEHAMDSKFCMHSARYVNCPSRKKFQNWCTASSQKIHIW